MLSKDAWTHTLHGDSIRIISKGITSSKIELQMIGTDYSIKLRLQFPQMPSRTS